MQWTRERMDRLDAWDKFWSSMIGILTVLLVLMMIVGPPPREPATPAEQVPISLGMD